MQEFDQGLEVLAGLERYLTRDVEIVAKDLKEFAALMVAWQDVQNLVSRETLPHLWSRHMRDSLQLLTLIREPCGVMMDVGSGGGFPAIPLAIALRSTDVEFRLIESNKRKSAFLRMVARKLQLPIIVHGERIENLAVDGLLGPDIITSRATAPLGELFGLVFPYWQTHTRGLFHKGKNSGEELAKTAAGWHYDVVEWPSETDVGGRILEIKNLMPVS